MTKKTHFKSNSVHPDKRTNLSALRKKRSGLRNDSVTPNNQVIENVTDAFRHQKLTDEQLVHNLSALLKPSSSFYSRVLAIFGNRLKKDQSVVVASDDGREVPVAAREDAGKALAHAALNDAYVESLTNNTNRPATPSWVFHSAKEAWRKNLKELKQEGKSFFARFSKKFSTKSVVRGTSILRKYSSSVSSLQAATKRISQSKDPAVKVLNYKFNWRCVKKVAAAASFIALFGACTHVPPVQNNFNNQSNDSADTTRTELATVNTEQQNLQDVQTDSNTYVVPVDSARITEVARESTIDFFNKSIVPSDSAYESGYDFALSRLTDDIMKSHFPGKTREEVLNSVRFDMSKPSYAVAKSDTARIAAEFFAYLGDCDGAKIPNNLSSILIEQFSGDRNVLVTSVNPCNQTMETKRLKAVSNKAKVSTNVQQDEAEETPVTEVTGVNEVVETSNDEVIKDTTNFIVGSVTDFVERKDSTIYNDGEYKEYSSNQDGIPLDVYKTQDDPTELNLSSMNVNVAESHGSEPQGSLIDKTDILSENADTLNNVLSGKQDIQGDSINFNLHENSIPSVSVDSITSATSFQAPVFTTTATDDFSLTDNDTVNVIVDSDSIPAGTPGAGYVPERGGVDYSGLTQHQEDLAKKFFEKKFASEFDDYTVDIYNDFVSSIDSRDDFRAKGGLVEGATGRQAAFMLSAWASYYPSDPDIKVFLNYVIGCDQNKPMPEDISNRIKAKLDLVRQNHTLDGKPYDRNTILTRYTYNGCDEATTYTIGKTHGGKPSIGGGDTFTRFYWSRTTRTFPFTMTDEILSKDSVLAVDPAVQEYFSNEDQRPIKRVTASTSDALSTKLQGMEVMVENGSVATASQDVTATHKAEKKKSNESKKLAETNKKYIEYAKKHGISPNLVQAVEDPKAADIIEKFFEKRSVSAKELYDYQRNIQAAIASAYAAKDKS